MTPTDGMPMDIDDESPMQNRTGTALAPDRRAAMIDATREFPPSSEGDGEAIAAVRADYARPAVEDGPVETTLLMDKLGERLAFERVGVRLYEALISKHDAYGTFDGGPSREDLSVVLQEERRHFDLLRATIEALGGDPTELTPSANLQLTASRGVGQVLTDPATDLVQSLEAITIAELADNESWEGLVGLARMAGDDALAAKCADALATEQEHLDKVRTWLAAGQGRLEVEGDDAIEAEGNGDAGKRREPPARKKRPRSS